jgi:hypothetical protein
VENTINVMARIFRIRLGSFICICISPHSIPGRWFHLLPGLAPAGDVVEFRSFR